MLDHECLCLKQEFITEFHDSIITASHLAIQQFIPYSHQSKVKVIPGWDIDMDIARDKSMFWHGIWKDCGKMPSGVVYSIMKKTRSTYPVAYLGFHFGGGSNFFWKSGGICMARSAMQRVAKPRVC